MLPQNRRRKYAITGLFLCLFTAMPTNTFAADPLSNTALAQKKLALQLFNKDASVQAELKALQDSRYKLLSTDAIPYRFAYGDEGAHSNFLVTAWLGRSEGYGWTAAFVTAKVNTDSFGPPGVKIIKSKEIEKWLE